MPSKRTRISRNQRTRITPEVVAAFRAGDHMRLHRLLRLRPWEASPLDADGECPYPASAAGAKSWPQAVELREALENAIEQE